MWPLIQETSKQEKRLTLEDVSQACIASRKNLGIAAATLGKDRTLMKQFRSYCDSRGYILRGQLTVADRCGTAHKT